MFPEITRPGTVSPTAKAARPELLRGLVLSNTAARMGTPEAWAARIAAIRGGGMAAIADAVMERWFAARFRARPQLAIWRNMLLRSPVEGYVAACAALAAADLTGALAAPRVPVEVIAGAEDGASAPDLVAALAAAIPGAGLTTLPGVGHIPPVEAPRAMAAVIARLAGTAPAP